MKIGWIGLGDVGSRLASGAAAEGGAEVFGFDSNVGSERMAQHEARCRENHVEIVADLATLIEKSDVVMTATSPMSALAVAEGAAAYLCKGKTYVDLNSAVPDIKRRIQSVVEKTGADFCDGGILGAPIADGVHVSIALSGACSEQISLQLNAHAFNTKSVGPEVGQASGLKILRSIFTKGVEALLIESYTAAYSFHVLDEVKGAIFKFLSGDLDRLFNSVISTDVVHSFRRAHEIGGVADMLDAAGLDSTMSRAAEKKLMWTTNSGAKEHFGAQDADCLDVI